MITVSKLPYPAQSHGGCQLSRLSPLCSPGWASREEMGAVFPSPGWGGEVRGLGHDTWLRVRELRVRPLRAKGQEMRRRQREHTPEPLISWRQKAKQILTDTSWELWAPQAWRETRKARLRKQRIMVMATTCFTANLLPCPCPPPTHLSVCVPVFGLGLWPPEA